MLVLRSSENKYRISTSTGNILQTSNHFLYIETFEKNKTSRKNIDACRYNEYHFMFYLHPREPLQGCMRKWLDVCTCECFYILKSPRHTKDN